MINLDDVPDFYPGEENETQKDSARLRDSDKILRALEIEEEEEEEVEKPPNKYLAKTVKCLFLLSLIAGILVVCYEFDFLIKKDMVKIKS